MIKANAVPPSPSVMGLRVIAVAIYLPRLRRRSIACAGFVCCHLAEISHALFDQSQTRAGRLRLTFQRLEIGDDVTDLVSLEPELRHVLVSGLNSLGERLLQTFNRVLQVQRAERRRDLEWAFAHL